MGEIQILEGEGAIGCIGLGSCIGLCVFDTSAKIAGVAHIMLPQTLDSAPQTRPAKFADSGVPTLIEMMERLGATKPTMKAAVIGGAHVLQGTTTNAMMQFGARNAQVVTKLLAEYDIECIGQDTGGHSGRTLNLDLKTGILTVRTPATGDRLLCRFTQE